MEIGDLIQDKLYPEDIGIILGAHRADTTEYPRVFWVGGTTAGDITSERVDFLKTDFRVLSSAKKK